MREAWDKFERNMRNMCEIWEKKLEKHEKYKRNSREIWE